MKDLHPMALFRLSVLGPLVSRERLDRGELKRLIRELAARDYDIPGSRHSRLSEKTIEAWYYAWRRGELEALTPQPRSDRGRSKLAPEVQAAIVQAKRENPRRSINQLRRLLEHSGQVAKGGLERPRSMPPYLQSARHEHDRCNADGGAAKTWPAVRSCVTSGSRIASS